MRCEFQHVGFRAVFNPVLLVEIGLVDESRVGSPIFQSWICMNYQGIEIEVGLEWDW